MAALEREPWMPAAWKLVDKYWLKTDEQTGLQERYTFHPPMPHLTIWDFEVEEIDVFGKETGRTKIIKVTATRIKAAGRYDPPGRDWEKFLERDGSAFWMKGIPK